MDLNILENFSVMGGTYPENLVKIGPVHSETTDSNAGWANDDTMV